MQISLSPPLIQCDTSKYFSKWSRRASFASRDWNWKLTLDLESPKLIKKEKERDEDMGGQRPRILGLRNSIIPSRTWSIWPTGECFIRSIEQQYPLVRPPVRSLVRASQPVDFSFITDTAACWTKKKSAPYSMQATFISKQAQYICICRDLCFLERNRSATIITKWFISLPKGMWLGGLQTDKNALVYLVPVTGQGCMSGKGSLLISCWKVLVCFS